MEQKKLIVIDPKPIPEYALDVPSIVGFHLHFQSAFRQLNPNAWVDVHVFKFERAEGIAEDTDGLDHLKSKLCIIQILKYICHTSM
jgi:hypothetical protein